MLAQFFKTSFAQICCGWLDVKNRFTFKNHWLYHVIGKANTERDDPCHPRPLFRLLLSFQTNNFYYKYIFKSPFSILYWDLNPQPSELKSHLITTDQAPAQSSGIVYHVQCDTFKVILSPSRTGTKHLLFSLFFVLSSFPLLSSLVSSLSSLYGFPPIILLPLPKFFYYDRCTIQNSLTLQVKCHCTTDLLFYLFGVSSFFNGPIPASFCLFSLFSQSNFNNKNWKKCRSCARDLNPGPQEGRCRRNHGAMAATGVSSLACVKLTKRFTILVKSKSVKQEVSWTEKLILVKWQVSIPLFYDWFFDDALTTYFSICPLLSLFAFDCPSFSLIF